ncbi:uncharacterized protein LOC108670056 [Hyalella azteca]|uniref:NADH dehydrogenase [ubiquinone] 1 subunit C2 n=1 Tax=Hyalella azteca TaxID=294128 RepID=A0A8B7NH88_HYAAZ|nr:uncharacterized protein LOC108670056 [Hyalella azteca]
MVCSTDTHIDPKSFYDPDSPRPMRSFVGQYWYQASCTVLGFGVACLHNFIRKRPVFAGLPRHAAFTLIGFGAGTWINNFIKRRSAERDYFYYQYMCDHPEDFPLIERKKFKDVMKHWTPVR